MRFVKLGLISIVLLFILVWLMSLLLPSEVRVSRAINIYASKESIAAELNHLDQWPQWNTLVSDSALASGLKVHFLKNTPDSVVTEWQRDDGRLLPAVFYLNESNGVTVVQWYFVFKLRWYPWEKLGSIGFDKQLGPQMEQSLDLLKKKMETTL